ncbi:hypothetical protein K435DRAFT_967514, partial [Dendrothele bispora CBS 962.96]
MSFRVSTTHVDATVDPMSPYSVISQVSVSSLRPSFYGLCFSAPLTLSLDSYAFTVPINFVISDSPIGGKDLVVGQDFLAFCVRAGIQVPGLGIVASVLPLETRFAPPHTENDNISVSSSTRLPSECLPTRFVQGTSTTSSSSPSLAGRNVPASVSDDKLREILLGSSSKGVRCNIFTNDIPKLHQCAANHGVDTRSLTSAHQCTIALVFHVMSGQCYHSSQIACRHVARDFASSQALSTQAFDIVCSASSKLLKLDHLRLVAKALGVEKHNRREILSALRMTCRTGKLSPHSPATLNPCPPADYHLPDPNFSAPTLLQTLRTLTRPVLLHIADTHMIAIDRYTSTVDTLRSEIVSHVCRSRCYFNFCSIRDASQSD